MNAAGLLTTDGKRWHLSITRNMSFWHNWLSLQGQYNHTVDFGIPHRQENIGISLGGTNTSMFTNEENGERYLELLRTTLLDAKKMRIIERLYTTKATALIRATTACKRNLTAAKWHTFANQYMRYTPALNLTAFGGRALTAELLRLLKERGFADAEIPSMAAKITYPKKHTPLFESQFALLRIGCKIEEGTLAPRQGKAALKRWLGAYGHIPVNFCEEPWTIDDVDAQLRSIMKNGCRNEERRLVAEHRRKVKEAGKELKRINDEDIAAVAVALRKVTYLNEFRKGIFSRVSRQLREIFAAVAHRAGLPSWRDCFKLTATEIEGILKGVKLSREVLAQRELIGYRSMDDGTVAFLDKETTQRFADHVQAVQGKSPTASQAAVKGFSANRGVLRGVARIILSKKDFERLKPGEILVTTMTSVDFIPVMQRAGAFVTNEGGITCHASIVAREMDKPCIIGTGNATHVFKDGDLIEVDADAGTVKRIQKR